MIDADLRNKQPRLWDGRKCVKKTPEEIKADLAWLDNFFSEVEESNKIEPLGDDFMDACKGKIKW
jgi:hypothetical protein